MYDVLCKSAIFGVRNADKVANTNDKGRIFADVGQFTNAAKAAAQLDNALGKGAQAAIGAMSTVAEGNKALDTLAKGANWASHHVNPLLVGAAGYRVVVAEDKESALKREILGMASMFAFEGSMKEFQKSNCMKNFRAGIQNKYLKTAFSVLEGVLFVCGSITGSTIGYKVGDYLFPEKKSKNKLKTEKNSGLNIEKTSKIINKTLDSAKRSENCAAASVDNYENDFNENYKNRNLLA